MFRITVIVALLITFNLNADVLSSRQGETGVVQVVTQADQTVSFLYCKSADQASCKYLGPKEAYTRTELEFVRQRLSSQIRRTIASDLTHFALSAGIAALTAVIAGTHGFVAVAIKAVIAAAGSTVVIAKGYLFPDGNNPRLKYRLVKTLSSRSLTGSNLYLREPMDEFARRLDDALRSLLRAPASLIR